MSWDDDLVDERHATLLGTTRRALRTLDREKRHPISEHWSFVTPVAPATEDDTGGTATSAFEGPWGNIDATFYATAFRLFGGKLQLRLAATGGEGTPGSTIFTLPATHWPLRVLRLFIVLGSSGIGIVDANPDGTVVFMGQLGA